MAQLGETSREVFPELLNVSQIAVRLLVAWRRGGADWIRQLEMASMWAARSRPSNTLEMERLEVLSGVLESLHQKSRLRGAIGLLEQLAGCFPQNTLAQNTPVFNGWPLLPGKPAVVRCSQCVQ